MSWIPPALTAGGGLLGGLFGGGGDAAMPPEMQRVFQFLMQSARSARQFGGSVPLSMPQEQMALAQQRGLAGQDMNSQRNRIYAAMSPTDLGNPGAMGDALKNLGSNQAAQLQGIDATHLLNALNQRYQMKYQGAPQLASMAGGAAGQGYSAGLGQAQFGAQQSSGLFGSLGSLAQMLAYQQARRQPGTPPIAPTGTVGGGGLPGDPAKSGMMPDYRSEFFG
jgi:hypothetical protein